MRPGSTMTRTREPAEIPLVFAIRFVSRSASPLPQALIADMHSVLHVRRASALLLTEQLGQLKLK